MAEKKRFSDVWILSNAILVSGVTAFILGVIAENAKPTEASLAPVVIGNVHVCSYPKDSSPALGTAGLVFLVVSLFLSLVALVYPYNQKSVPVRALLKSKSLVFFSVLSFALSLTAAGLLLWATVAEATRRKFHVVDASTVSSCPTAKPGLFGAAAFLALDATLFWLVVVMLTVNARNNFLQGDDDKGVYGELAVRYSATAQLPAAASNV